jgi:hypothetical protein
MKLLVQSLVCILHVIHSIVSDQSFVSELNESIPLWVCIKAMGRTVAMGTCPLLAVCDMDVDLCYVRLVI